MRPTLLLLFGLLALSFRPDKPAYRLYDAKTKASSYDQLLRRATDADVVLFGELHNNPICHWLELQLAKDLAEQKKGQFVLGAEMFETDTQTALTDYVQGRTTDKEFATQARLWSNYDTDYKPLTALARAQKLPFVATNVPRKYASMVARRGLSALDTIPAITKQLLAPLPLTVDLTRPGYKAMMAMMGDSNHGSSNAPNPHGSSTDMAANFARAQALKDATMAYFILQNRKPGQTLLHINGDYHSKNFDGIVGYLRDMAGPSLKILTISSIDVADPDKPKVDDDTKLSQLADFVIAIPADMTKTY
jgi:uncharacterized iron-regulated protein